MATTPTKKKRTKTGSGKPKLSKPKEKPVGRKGLTRDERISRLKSSLGEEGVTMARKLMKKYPDECRLAALLLKPPTGRTPKQQEIYDDMVREANQEAADIWWKSYKMRMKRERAAK